MRLTIFVLCPLCDSFFFFFCRSTVVRERRVRRRSGQRVSDSATEDFDDKENVEDVTDGQPPNPKIEREIEELSKIPDSGAAKVILEQLKKKKYETPTLDPRSASRTPNAASEPPYKTRYESSIFACMLHFEIFVFPMIIDDQ